MEGPVPNAHETSITLIPKPGKDKAKIREQRATVPEDHKFRTFC